jgi:hypothetical protein|tara:strand:- start:298 stop:468 length:171 start_codon:yes stop_codon:yes gene_type:complete
MLALAIRRPKRLRPGLIFGLALTKAPPEAGLKDELTRILDTRFEVVLLFRKVLRLG